MIKNQIKWLVLNVLVGICQQGAAASDAKDRSRNYFAALEISSDESESESKPVVSAPAFGAGAGAGAWRTGSTVGLFKPSKSSRFTTKFFREIKAFFSCDSRKGRQLKLVDRYNPACERNATHAWKIQNGGMVRFNKKTEKFNYYGQTENKLVHADIVAVREHQLAAFEKIVSARKNQNRFDREWPRGK